MTENKWHELVDLLDQRFGISAQKKYSEKLEDAPQLLRQVDRVEFSRDGDDYRVERVVSPAILDKKTFYSKTGTSQHSQYIYDPEETQSKVLFYRRSGEQWHELKPETLLS